MALVKLEIIVERTGDKLDALFNPEEYTINKENAFAVQAIPGLGAPILQYVNGNLRTLEMELFFDTYDTNSFDKVDVRNLTGQVMRLMEIDSELHAPPVLIVSWSSLQFRCVLARASQKFIMFGSDGRPVRARLSVTFNEYVDLEREAKQDNLQTADFTKLHVVAEGETLSAIAAARYENPQLWRPIAIANRLADPRAIRVGQSLKIPSLPFIDPDTREVVA